MPLPFGTVFNAQLGSETADEDESTDLLGRQGRLDFRQKDANVHLDTICMFLREFHCQVWSAWTGTNLTGKHAHTHIGLGENTFEKVVGSRDTHSECVFRDRGRSRSFPCVFILKVVGCRQGIGKVQRIHRQMSCLSVDAVLKPELDPDLCFQPTFFSTMATREMSAQQVPTTSCVLPQCNSKESTEDGISMRELQESKNTSKTVLVMVSRLKIGRIGRRRWVHTLKSEDDQDEDEETRSARIECCESLGMHVAVVRWQLIW